MAKKKAAPNPPARPRYTAVFNPAAERALRKIKNQDDRRRIGAAVDELVADPRRHGVEKMTDSKVGVDVYRYRAGDWRILFTIEDRELVIEVVRIANRKEVYR